MLTHRFGRKLKLPSTVAIKHGILKMMLRDQLATQAVAAKPGAHSENPISNPGDSDDQSK